MYFPIGWPKYLSIGQGKKSCLKYIICNRYRMLFAVLTESTISIWHCQVGTPAIYVFGRKCKIFALQLLLCIINSHVWKSCATRDVIHPLCLWELINWQNGDRIAVCLL